ncbi:MAG: C-terminal target protein [Bacteroidetes bacterium]|nr:C-terminal target protein [Bacteroidota bacterium]
MKSIFTILFVLLMGWAQGQTYTSGVVTLSNTSGLEMNVKIDLSTNVTLTMTGPSSRWFSIGFNTTQMANGVDVFVSHKVAPLTTPDAYLTGYSAPTYDPSQDWTIVSDVTVGTARTIVATRSLNTGDIHDYTFSAQSGNLNVIWARGNSNTFNLNDHGSNHMGSRSLTFTLVPTPPAAPTGAAQQSFCEGNTLADLVVTGAGIKWYSSATSTTVLPSTTPLVNGSIYYATQTVAGLESIERLAVTANLTVIDVSLIVNGTLMTAVNTSGTYQWVDCNNNFEPLPFATQQFHNATVTGSYAVEITQDGCTKRSDCLDVVVIGINENENKYKINLYPNPADQYTTIAVDGSLIGKTYAISNSNGVALIRGVINHENMMISLTTLPSGFYIFTIDDNDRQTVKLIKK